MGSFFLSFSLSFLLSFFFFYFFIFCFLSILQSFYFVSFRSFSLFLFSFVDSKNNNISLGHRNIYNHKSVAKSKLASCIKIWFELLFDCQYLTRNGTSWKFPCNLLNAHVNIKKTQNKKKFYRLCLCTCFNHFTFFLFI